jgi:hypothetical protein
MNQCPMIQSMLKSSIIDKQIRAFIFSAGSSQTASSGATYENTVDNRAWK